jgi:protein gp37
MDLVHLEPPDRLHQGKLPLSGKKPQLIFVNSMSDMFHKDVSPWFIHRTFDVMRRASWHQFQVLTKRSERLLEMSPAIDCPDNVWMGVSVESQDYAFRIDHLRKTGAAVKFLSLEPLLGSLPRLDLREINWAIVGGESGPGARPTELEWVLEIKAQCQRAQVPFFFKQWGGFNKKKAGRLLQGRTWDELPKLPETLRH